MKRYLILKLHGVMQAWGGHTFEDLRHTELFPTRSGIIGLLAACMGIDRKDVDRLKALNSSVVMAVRSDRNPVRITDFHTILDARKVDGKPNKYPIVSRREYLCDAEYTAAIQSKGGASVAIEEIQKAVQAPVFTPSLGRRSCPLSHPLFQDIVEAKDYLKALELVPPGKGIIYSEESLGRESRMELRDVPQFLRNRQFGKRNVFIHAPDRNSIGDHSCI